MSINNINRLPMKFRIRILISFVFFAIPTIILSALISLFLIRIRGQELYSSLIIGLIIAASINYTINFIYGFHINQPQEWEIVERFGIILRVCTGGWRVIIPLIDKVVARGGFAFKQSRLFGDSEEKINFVGASASVEAYGFWCVGMPYSQRGNMSRKEWRKCIQDDVFNFHYSYEGSPEIRVITVLEGHLRPELQKRTLQEAQTDKTTLLVDVLKEVTPILQSMGVYLKNEYPLVVEDIVLPPEIVELRQKVLDGEMEAAGAIAKSLGYYKPIVDIAHALNITTAEAMQFFLTNRGLETVTKLRANVTLVSSDLKNIMPMIGVGATTTPTNGSGAS